MIDVLKHLVGTGYSIRIVNQARDVAVRDTLLVPLDGGTRFDGSSALGGLAALVLDVAVGDEFLEIADFAGIQVPGGGFSEALAFEKRGVMLIDGGEVEGVFEACAGVVELEVEGMSEGLGLPQAAAAFVYVRVAELPAMAAVALLALPAITAALARSARGVAVAIAVAAVALAAAWLGRRRLREQVAVLRARSAPLTISRAAFGGAVFYASLAQIETIVRQIVMAAAFALPLTISQSATVTALSIAGGLVPTIGSLGAIEGSMVAGLMMCGATADTAVAITLVERAISYGLSTALGAASLTVIGGRAVLRVASRNRDAVTAG